MTTPAFLFLLPPGARRRQFRFACARTPICFFLLVSPRSP
jgi:hypothetical protein